MQLLSKLRNRSGFTLVELIIVIMIIGILSATLLPKVMGAPARARDAGRVRAMDSLALALNQYYSDNGAFPGATGTHECMIPTAGSGLLLVNGGYMLASDFPSDPTANATVDDCVGSYYYVPLSKNGIDANAFLTAADVENDGQSNATVACATGAETTSTVESVDTCVKDGRGASVGADAIFVKIGGM